MVRTFVCLILLLNCYPAYAEKIIVGSDEWLDYAHADGSGIYFEVLKQIYPDLELEFRIEPFDKSLKSFHFKKVDMVVGVHKDELPSALYPIWHLDAEYPVVAFYNKKATAISSASDLYNLNLSWIRGYGFERYISQSTKHSIVDDIDVGFELLAKQKIDAFLDYPYNLTAAEQKLYSSFEIAPSRYIYVAFQHNKLGKSLAHQFDKQMVKLRSQGKLATIFGKEYSYAKLANFDPSRRKLIMFTNSVSLLGKSKTNDSDNQSLHFIFDQIDGYEFEFRKLDNISEIYNYTKEQNVCFTDLIKTPEREQHFISSNALSLYLGLQLYSTEALNVDSSVDIVKLLHDNPPFRLGTANGRSYGQQLDSALEKVNRNQIVATPVDLNTIFRQLAKGWFNLLIEYPSEKARFWPQSSEQKLHSYPIATANDYILGYMMCNKSKLAEQFIIKLNNYLKRLYPSAVFFDTQYGKVPIEHREKFAEFFKLEFIKH